MHYSLARSKNVKLTSGARVYASMVSATSCPKEGDAGGGCPLAGPNGCYAGQGKMSWTWRAITEGYSGSARKNPALSFEQFRAGLRALPAGALFRHAQAGDVHNSSELRSIAIAGGHLIAWSYTHRKDADTLRAVKDTSREVAARGTGITWNVSCDTLAEVDASDLPSVTVLPLGTPKVTRTPKGRRVVLCWAQQKEGRTCSDCKGASGKPWCADPTRDFAVGFEAHGAKERLVSLRLSR